jgi:hypothetical protein
MKRQILVTLVGLSLVALSFSACGLPAQAAPPVPTSTVAPTATESPTDVPAELTETPAASHGGSVKDYVSLIDNLRAAGATVEPSGEVEQPFFGPVGYVISVSGAEVQTFEYPDEDAAKAEAAQVAPEGGSIGTNMVTWMATPHFYQQGRVIAIYVGDDATLLALLEGVLGPQFAGG